MKLGLLLDIVGKTTFPWKPTFKSITHQYPSTEVPKLYLALHLFQRQTNSFSFDLFIFQLLLLEVPHNVKLLNNWFLIILKSCILWVVLFETYLLFYSFFFFFFFWNNLLFLGLIPANLFFFFFLLFSSCVVLSWVSPSTTTNWCLFVICKIKSLHTLLVLKTQF